MPLGAVQDAVRPDAAATVAIQSNKSVALAGVTDGAIACVAEDAEVAVVTIGAITPDPYTATTSTRPCEYDVVPKLYEVGSLEPATFQNTAASGTPEP